MGPVGRTGHRGHMGRLGLYRGPYEAIRVVWAIRDVQGTIWAVCGAMRGHICNIEPYEGRSIMSIGDGYLKGPPEHDYTHHCRVATISSVA